MFKFNVLLAFSFVAIAVAGGHGPADSKLDVWDANLLQRHAEWPESHAGTTSEASLAESFNTGDTNNETVANNLAFVNDPVQVNMMFSVIASATQSTPDTLQASPTRCGSGARATPSSGESSGTTTSSDLFCEMVDCPVDQCENIGGSCKFDEKEKECVFVGPKGGACIDCKCKLKVQPA